MEGSFETVESTDIFPDVLFRPLHGTLCFITIYQSINVKLVGGRVFASCQLPVASYQNDNALVLSYSVLLSSDINQSNGQFSTDFHKTGINL